MSWEIWFTPRFLLLFWRIFTDLWGLNLTSVSSVDFVLGGVFSRFCRPRILFLIGVFLPITNNLSLLNLDFLSFSYSSHVKVAQSKLCIALFHATNAKICTYCTLICVHVLTLAHNFRLIDRPSFSFCLLLAFWGFHTITLKLKFCGSKTNCFLFSAHYFCCFEWYQSLK